VDPLCPKHKDTRIACEKAARAFWLLTASDNEQLALFENSSIQGFFTKHIFLS